MQYATKTHTRRAHYQMLHPVVRQKATEAIARAGRQLADSLLAFSLTKTDRLATILFRAMYCEGGNDAVVELAKDVVKHPDCYSPTMVKAVRMCSPILAEAYRARYGTPRPLPLPDDLRRLALDPEL